MEYLTNVGDTLHDAMYRKYIWSLTFDFKTVKFTSVVMRVGSARGHMKSFEKVVRQQITWNDQIKRPSILLMVLEAHFNPHARKSLPRIPQKQFRICR
jgi:hypothetical protein